MTLDIANMHLDTPKSLKHEAAAALWRAELGAAHVSALVSFVGALRREKGANYQIPYFDPFDAGIEAECLFLLEAPGPQAKGSGFVSRNNPDETAKNFLELTMKIGIPRSRTATWNVVPWYVSKGSRIRPVNQKDIIEARPSLLRLLGLLPKLRIVALVGRKAASVESWLSESMPELQVFTTAHPSPMFVNRAPVKNRELLHQQFTTIAVALNAHVYDA